MVCNLFKIHLFLLVFHCFISVTGSKNTVHHRSMSLFHTRKSSPQVSNKTYIPHNVQFISKKCFFFLIDITVSKFIEQNQLPHLLFYGPPGTGKTTSILACARKLYAEKEFQSMVLELNASDDRGIGIVRGRILDFASTKTIFSKGFKLIILDEADAMTNDAQNALRRGI